MKPATPCCSLVGMVSATKPDGMGRNSDCVVRVPLGLITRLEVIGSPLAMFTSGIIPLTSSIEVNQRSGRFPIGTLVVCSDPASIGIRAGRPLVATTTFFD